MTLFIPGKFQQVLIVHNDIAIGASGGDHRINVFLGFNDNIEQVGLVSIFQHPRKSGRQFLLARHPLSLNPLTFCNGDKVWVDILSIRSFFLTAGIGQVGA